MANWINKIDISKEFRAAKAYEIAPQELAKAIADKLEGIKAPDFLKDDLEFLIENLRWLSELDDSEDREELLDGYLEELFNIGDTSVDNKGTRFLWIKTI